MKRFIAIVSLSVIAFACSKSGGFKKTKSGLQYKIISDGKGSVAKKGEFLKLHYTHRINDSVVTSSFDGLPTYAQVDSVGAIYNPAEIFGLLKKGDSAVVVMSPDSLFKNQQQMPPNIKKNDRIVLTVRVIDVLKNEEELRKDQVTLSDQQRAKEIQVIQKYLDSKNISAEKTEKGTFVEILSRGSGAQVDSGKTVMVNYTGQTFDGEVFDSNVDSSFGHPEPYAVVIGSRGAIEGWYDGLSRMRKGDKARLYIPSMLAYGPNPPPGAPIKPMENLIFEVEIVEVTNTLPSTDSRIPRQTP